MKTITLGRILSVFGVGIVLLGRPTSAPASTATAVEAVPASENTFTITRTATTAFTRDTDKLKAEVQEDAAKYCAAQGKQLKIVNLTAKKPLFSMGYASAKIVFKALSATEVEAALHAPTTIDGSPKPDSTGDLYSDILKLDDLRKRGLLTEEEFQSEKKKALARSK